MKIDLKIVIVLLFNLISFSLFSVDKMNNTLIIDNSMEIHKINRSWKFIADDNYTYNNGGIEKFNWKSAHLGTPWQVLFQSDRNYYDWSWYSKDFTLNNYLDEEISLFIPICFGQVEVFINDKQIFKSEKDFGTTNNIVNIPNDYMILGKNHISLRVKSYSGWGGFSGFMRIGSTSLINKVLYLKIIKNSAIGFICLFLFIYFFIRFLFRKKEKYNFMFSIMCISVSFFIFGYNGISYYFSYTSWSYWFLTFIGGVGMYLLPILFIHKFYNIRLKLVSKIFTIFYIFLGLFICFEFIITNELFIFNKYLYMFFNLSYILLVIYLVVLSIKAMHQELRFSKLMMLGIILLSLSFVFSMFCFTGIINTTPLIGEGFFAMVIVFSIVLAKRFAQTHSDLELSHALNLELNSTLENKVNYRTRELNLRNQEVTESIEYAALIQNSILPSYDSLARNLSDFYVCWKPKGIVGGDFYWFNSKGDDFLVAIVDCTGHGVPGAMLTMTATSVLERIVAHINRTNPAKILNEMNKILKSILQREDTDYVTDDGLDIGLCYYNSRDNLLTYAGSRIRLHVVEEGYLREFKGDSQGIGYERSKEDYEYTNHEIKVTKDLSFYMTTDGYLDQSGGDFEFGFGWSKYKRLLVENHEDDMGTQLIKLEQALDKYQKDFEQRDDITLLGFKVKIDE